MAAGGAWAGMFGWLVGTGPGAGMGLMFVGTAIGGTLMSLSGYLFRSIRQVEDDPPDHDITLAASPPLASQAVVTD